MIAGVPYDAEVEYLQSTGTQYIKTDVKANQNTSAFIRFLFVDSPNAVLSMDSGSAGNNAFTIEGNLNLGIIFSFDGLSGMCIERNPLSLNKWYEVNAEGSGMTVNGYFVRGGPYAVFNGDYGLFMFAYGRNGSPAWYSKSRISKCQLRQGTTLVRDLIPVRVGTVGYMYDRVTRKLFGNAGTGAFVLGPDAATPVMGLRRYPQIGGAA